MTSGKFYRDLAIVSVATFGCMYGLQLMEPFAPYFYLSVAVQVFFIFFSVLMFEVGKIALQNENKNLFTSLVIGFTFGKMLLAVLIVIVYAKAFAPESQLFVAPFFLVYLIYTIFETSFMMRLGNPKTKKDDQL